GPGGGGSGGGASARSRCVCCGRLAREGCGWPGRCSGRCGGGWRAGWRAAVVVTIASYWYTHLSRRTPGRTFLYGQALFDVALITTVVHITGGPQSDL